MIYVKSVTLIDKFKVFCCVDDVFYHISSEKYSVRIFKMKFTKKYFLMRVLWG